MKSQLWLRLNTVLAIQNDLPTVLSQKPHFFTRSTRQQPFGKRYTADLADVSM